MFSDPDLLQIWANGLWRQHLCESTNKYKYNDSILWNHTQLCLFPFSLPTPGSSPDKGNMYCLVNRAEKRVSGVFRSIPAHTMDLLHEPVASSGLWGPWAYQWLEDTIKSQTLQAPDRAALWSTTLLNVQGSAFRGVSPPRSLEVWKRVGYDHTDKNIPLILSTGETGFSTWQPWYQQMALFELKHLKAPCHQMVWRGIGKGTSLPNSSITSTRQQVWYQMLSVKPYQQKLMNRKAQLNTDSQIFLLIHSEGEGLSWCRLV